MKSGKRRPQRRCWGRLQNWIAGKERIDEEEAEAAQEEETQRGRGAGDGASQASQTQERRSAPRRSQGGAQDARRGGCWWRGECPRRGRGRRGGYQAADGCRRDAARWRGKC